MCVIDELLQDTLSTTNILKYVDDYSIYTYYIGENLELKTRYSSPLRKGDDNPSFCLFEGRGNRIFFKDHATSYKGDVFNFVRILMTDGKPEKIPFESVLKKIDNDLQIGLYSENGLPSKLPIKRLISLPKKESYTIKITSHKIPTKNYINYWKDKYDIELDTLNYYNVSDVAVLHYVNKSKVLQFVPNSLCIAYRIGGRYEIYHPFEDKKKKFRNDLPENWIKGYLQLKHNNDFLIITKAMKEVIFFRQHFDWDAVAGKSETTMIPNHLMLKLLKEYKRVYIWLDPDKAGQDSQNNYLTKYPSLIPIKYNQTEQKDVTDRYEYLKTLNQTDKAINEIKELIN